MARFFIRSTQPNLCTLKARLNVKQSQSLCSAMTLTLNQIKGVFLAGCGVCLLTCLFAVMEVDQSFFRSDSAKLMIHRKNVDVPVVHQFLNGEANFFGLSKNVSHTISDRRKHRHVAESLKSDNRNFSCPLHYNSSYVRSHISNLTICSDTNSKTYDLLLFTTMYYSNASLDIFKNTLRVTASMQERLNLKAVMFIENPGAFVSANETKFIQYACDLGWTVLLAPHCNKFGFPVFKSMFDVAMSTWDAEWYGYSNADVLFDASLMKTIKFIQAKSDVIDIPMLVGRRYSLKVSIHYALPEGRD